MKPQLVDEIDAPSHHEVNRSVRPRFKCGLETDEIPHETVFYGHCACRREPIRHIAGITGVVRCVLAAGPVKRRIRDSEVGGESTAGNLIVIIGVTPTPNAAGGIWIPERAVLEIRRVCYKTNWLSDTETTCRDRTKSPVPIRLSPLISAFLPKGDLEVLEVCAMPGQKVSSVVDLDFCWISVREIDFAGTYDRSEIHMDIDPVYFGVR